MASRYREKKVEVRGEVRAANLDRRTFVLALDDGSKIACRFGRSHEATVIDALHQHEQVRLRVRGIGRFALPERKLKRMIAIDRVFVETNGATAEQDRRPLWEKIEEISRSVPPEEWAKIPSDASINLDHYLYGAPKQDE